MITYTHIVILMFIVILVVVASIMMLFAGKKYRLGNEIDLWFTGNYPEMSRSDVVYITFATHMQGTLHELINNKYGIPIFVCGWGTRWKGYIESKAKGICEVAAKLPAKTIVCYLDGFDSKFNKSPGAVKEKFLKMKANIVFSEDGFTFGRTLTKLRFGTTANGTVINAGMFVGYAGALTKFMQLVIAQERTSDDQEAINLLARNPLHKCKVDTSHILFENLSRAEQQSNAIMVSYPFAVGRPFKEKVQRFTRDYGRQTAMTIALLVTIVIIIVAIAKKANQLLIKQEL